jgi:hypothetical protein
MMKRSFLRRMSVLFFVSGLVALVAMTVGIILRMREACTESQHAVHVAVLVGFRVGLVLGVSSHTLPLVVNVDLSERDTCDVLIFPSATPAMNGSANSATTGAPDMITSTIRRDETPQCAAVKN